MHVSKSRTKLRGRIEIVGKISSPWVGGVARLIHASAGASPFHNNQRRHLSVHGMVDLELDAF